MWISQNLEIDFVFRGHSTLLCILRIWESKRNEFWAERNKSISLLKRLLVLQFQYYYFVVLFYYCEELLTSIHICLHFETSSK
jgi:hypothetical protein